MQSQLRGLTAYDRHKLLINEYYLSIPGGADILKRDKYVKYSSSYPNKLIAVIFYSLLKDKR
jgi:hypothetical protein